MPEFCYSLVCPPEIEEALLDALVVAFDTDVFTSVPVFSHGTPTGKLSAAEQVMGRSRSSFIQILVSAVEAQALRVLLQKQFAGTGIQYWSVALADNGGVL